MKVLRLPYQKCLTDFTAVPPSLKMNDSILFFCLTTTKGAACQIQGPDVNTFLVPLQILEELQSYLLVESCVHASACNVSKR